MWSLLSHPNKMVLALLISLLVLSAHQTSSLSTPTIPNSTSKKAPVSRFTFLQTAILPSLLVLTNNPLKAQALGGAPKPSLEGTKEDPDYKNCLAIELYDCTKPKGNEQRTRKECLPECKVKCATTKAQLLLGAPIKK
mmetsp:Transcript_4438/g.5141  ORF Transcript_4438/g.5141 Transcript_4438/m.5141 type:complete len:138 (+) Transcript_4438:92-505(+)